MIWFNWKNRLSSWGGGEYCPTKEDILTVKEYDNYTLDEIPLESYINNQLVQEPDIIYNTDEGTSTIWYAYVRVPTFGCTGIINYDMTVYYSWNEVDGTYHDAVRTDRSGTLTADGGTHYIVLGVGTFTPGENYWYNGSFRSACTTFNFSIHVDGTSSNGNYYS